MQKVYLDISPTYLDTVIAVTGKVSLVPPIDGYEWVTLVEASEEVHAGIISNGFTVIEDEKYQPINVEIEWEELPYGI